MMIKAVLALRQASCPRKLVRPAYLLAAACLVAALAGCGGNSPSTPAPSNLVYAQSAITAVVGQAVASDTPTVTGTVTHYSVNPALPAGLSLSASTGVISGTATGAAAQASYTVTATNASGSTAGTVQIAVNPAAPASLAYPQSAITAVVGQAVASDTPTVTGTVAAYSVNPALPAGLSLSASTGAISGTPTAAAAQATYTVTATNVTGSTTAAVQITVNPAAPTSLVYPQTAITAAVGKAIASDTPTVTGAVASYTVSPALPAGLSLSSSTGVISGTPTAVSAQSTYTVTAANVTGSTTAAVQIAVNLAAPTNLVYAQTTVKTMVTQTIATDTPTVTGTVTSYSVSPALPAGLSLDTSTGAISGTAAAVTPGARYTITATNSTGSTTATVQITVNSFTAFSLVDLGHANSIHVMRLEPTRLFSQDSGGHWALWDYTGATELASGDQTPLGSTPQNPPYGADMAGSVMAIGRANAVDIRSNTDGSLITTLTDPSLDPASGVAWWKLATDGSYVVSGYSSGLSAWSTADGHLLFSRSGDYSKAKAFAAPGQIQIALGPAGAIVIETDSVPAGTSTTGTFTGSFNAWFEDGSHYITNSADLNPPGQPVSYDVYTYTASSAQDGMVVLSDLSGLNGYGSWFWAADPLGGVFNLYPVGATSPTATYPFGPFLNVVPMGSTIGLLPYGSATASILDLSGSSPALTTTALPVAYESAFAATSPTQWAVGNGQGVLLDGASVATAARYFGYGNALSMSGAAGEVAIATASGKILVYNPSAQSLITTIDFTSSKLAMSSDGTVLAAKASDLDSQYEPDRTLNIYSLPSGAVADSFPYHFTDSPPTPFLFDFVMSQSGNALGRMLGTYNGLYFDYTREVSPLSGSPIVWSDNPPSGAYLGTAEMSLSPDGTLIATSTPVNFSGGYPSSVTTSIYKNGTLVATVNGYLVGWIDNSRVLVNTFNSGGYSGSLIYDATGTLLTTVTALPQLSPALNSYQPSGFITVDANSIYSPRTYSIYSLTTGAVIWSETLPIPGTLGVPYGAASTVSGSYVVFTSGTRVVVDLP